MFLCEEGNPACVEDGEGQGGTRQPALGLIQTQAAAASAIAPLVVSASVANLPATPLAGSEQGQNRVGVQTNAKNQLQNGTTALSTYASQKAAVGATKASVTTQTKATMGNGGLAPSPSTRR